MPTTTSSWRRLAGFLAFGALASAAWGQAYVPDEVLVRYHPGNEFLATSAPEAIAARPVELLRDIGVYRLKLNSGISVSWALQRLRRLPGVEFAEPNYIVRADTTPNDPDFSTKQAQFRKIRCEPAWDLGVGDPNIIIAIVDTGVDLSHPDLAGKLVPGYDFENGDSSPNDDNGHGTHCAGNAAAATNNGVGIAGVGWSCRIMPVKVLDSRGSGSTSNIAAGINYAANNGANVISLSLGTSSNSSTLLAAVNNAQARNAVVVASAGNEGNQNPKYPAYFSNVIAVAAVDDSDQRALFSSYGSWVDVAAPGVSVYSLYKNGGYRYMSGTSMACPMVAGLAGLLWAQLGTSTSSLDLRARIEQNAIPVGSWVVHGRIDVERALLNLGPPSEVRRDFEPSQFGVQAGDLVSGSLASLAVSDDDRLDLNAIRAGAGRSASFYAAAIPTWTGQRIGLEAAAEISTSPAGSVRLAFYNWNTLSWQSFATRSVGSGDRTFRITATDPTPFVGADGKVLVQVQRVEARNRPFRLRADQVAITSISLE